MRRRGWRFDLIVALDVLEHIEDDQTAARALAGMLRPGGWLVVTVPAFGVLWDRHDEINEHWRRYTVGGVRGLLEGVGLRVERARYLYRLLFAPKWVVARWNRWWGRGRPVAQHGVPPGVWNRLLEWVCVGEDRLLRGLPVPFGTSALAVARRAWE
ncbi:MAG: hypothetical protein KatS3mg108_0279 [Isosphaeraceae bacterium]|nr:MAG: hypothetical protein KatS3mg108_0279 [Isosphaeraceae bacterium]